MTREIKFRGIPTFGKEFVYGCLDIYENEKGLVYSIRNYEERHGLSVYEVDPETIGQFTGLLDCKGKEIYENDVVQATKIRDKGFSVAGNGNTWDSKKKEIYKKQIRFKNGSFQWGYISFDNINTKRNEIDNSFSLSELVIEEKMIASEWRETYENFKVIGCS